MRKIGANSSLAEMLQASTFAVEANSYEQQSLWKEHHQKVKWEEVLSGYLPQIGTFGGQPVTVSVRVAYIDGQLVLFYYGCSRVVDHDMVEAYIDQHVARKWDHGTRRAQCDANNFHLCLHAVRELNEQQAAQAKSTAQVA